MLKSTSMVTLYLGMIAISRSMNLPMMLVMVEGLSFMLEVILMFVRRLHWLMLLIL